MRVFARVKPGMLLGASWGAVALIGLLIAGFGALQLRALTEQMEELAKKRLNSLIQVSELKDHTNAVVIALRDLPEVHGPAALARKKREILQTLQDNAVLLETLRTHVKTPRGQMLLDRVYQERPAFLQASRKALDLAVSHQDREARSTVANEVAPSQKRLFAVLDALFQWQRDATLMAAQGAGSGTATVVLLLTVWVGLGLVCGAGTGWMLTRRALRSEDLAAAPASAASALPAIDTSHLLSALERQSLADIMWNVYQNTEFSETDAPPLASQWPAGTG